MARGGKKGNTAGAATGSKRMVNADRAIASLEIQAKFWEERAAQMRDAVEAMRKQLREAERGGRILGLSLGRGPGRPPSLGIPGRRGPRGQGAGAVAAEILRDWGRPARVGELLPELAKRGIHVGGKNPSATLASTLLKYNGVSRAGRGLFVATKGGAENGGTGKKRSRPAKGGGGKRGRPAKAAAAKAEAPAEGAPEAQA